MIDNGYDLPDGFDGQQKRAASTFATGWYELEGWDVYAHGATDWFEQAEYLGLELEGVATGHTFEISDEPLPSAAELIEEQEARDREERK